MRIIEIKPIMPCPMCFGTGQDYSIKHHKLMPCTLCDGRKWVPLESCKGCGKPAFKWWPRLQAPIVRFCGLEACLSSLVKLHVPDKKKPIVDISVRRNVTRREARSIARAYSKMSPEEEIKAEARRQFGPAIQFDGHAVAFHCC